MARIERAEPRVQAPVKQAVLADPNAFRFTGAGEGLEAIGGILTELGERRKKAQDSLSITETNNSQRLAQAEIKQAMIDNPNPNDWPNIVQGILEKQNSLTSQFESSPEARARINQSQKAFREQTLLNSSVLQTEATIAIAIQSSGAALIVAMGTDDKLAIAEARDTHEADLLRKESPEIAALSLIETLKEGKKTFYENQSKLFPDKTIKEMEAKKKTLGKEGIDDDGLDAKDYSDIIRSAQTEIQSRNSSLNSQYRETERELHKKFITGTLTKEENDRAFNAGESNVNTHQAYDTIIKNKELTETDSVLSEKWLNGSLTKTDISEAQKEGRLNNSSVVGAWLSRLNQGQFNAGAYDRALTRIREVQFNKSKYDDVRLYLLKNAEDLGGKWDDLRNKLETAMDSKGDAAGAHVQRAHGLINGYAKDNPEINDGTLESINRIQRLHDDIDARADQTPEQIRNLTEALLLPYEEEKAKGWLSSAFETVTKFSPIGIALRGSRKIRAKKQKIFQSKMLVQPVSKGDFNKEVTSLKALFGDDSKEAKQFYDRYVDSYNWETE